MVRLTFDVQSLAEEWGCSTDLIYDLLRDGDLPGAFKIRRHWRIPVATVRRYELSFGTASADETDEREERDERDERDA